MPDRRFNSCWHNLHMRHQHRLCRFSVLCAPDQQWHHDRYVRCYLQVMRLRSSKHLPQWQLECQRRLRVRPQQQLQQHTVPVAGKHSTAHLRLPFALQRLRLCRANDNNINRDNNAGSCYHYWPDYHDRILQQPFHKQHLHQVLYVCLVWQRVRYCTNDHDDPDDDHCPHDHDAQATDHCCCDTTPAADVDSMRIPSDPPDAICRMREYHRLPQSLSAVQALDYYVQCRLPFRCNFLFNCCYFPITGLDDFDEFRPAQGLNLRDSSGVYFWHSRCLCDDR